MDHQSHVLADRDRKYRMGDSFYSQGVTVGSKTFDQLIAISSAILAFLLGLKAHIVGNVELGYWGNTFLILSITCFILTIICAIFRNYWGGYCLIHMGERLFCNASGSHDESSKAQKDEEKATRWRKSFSVTARWSFIAAIIFLGILVVII